MAYTFSTGNTPATGAIAMYLLAATLVTAGWSVIADSDGTTYNSSGGQVTSGSAGAGGLNNSNAWIRLQAPLVGSNTREITIQRGATSRGWRVKYSANANFTGGSPSNSQTGSATDEVFMLGGGTDASPTFNTAWFNTDGGYRWHIACGGTTEFYSFVAVALTSTTTTANNAIFLDVMASGSYPSEDVDPAVMYCSTAGSGGIGEIVSGSATATNVTNPAKARAWFGATTQAGASTTSDNGNVVIYTYSTVFGNTTNFAVNPFSSNDTLLQPFYVKATTQSQRLGGIKGFSTLFLIGSMARTNLDTATTIASNDKMRFGTVWMPWDGSTPTA